MIGFLLFSYYILTYSVIGFLYPSIFKNKQKVFTFIIPGIIIGFNVKPEAKAKQLAEKNKIDIGLYRVIYDAVDDITNKINGMQAPKYEEVITGHVEVRQIFKISSIGNIAGSYVLDGVVNRDSNIRVLRNNECIMDTSIDTLQHQKDQVKSVKLGYECGIKLKNFNDIEVGDILEAYTMQQIK